MQTSWLHVLQNWSYCWSKFCTAAIQIFNLCCSCDLDLDPMTFIYELLNLISILLRYTGWAKTNFIRQGFRKLSTTDIWTERHQWNCIPCRFVGGQKCGFPWLLSSSVNTSANLLHELDSHGIPRSCCVYYYYYSSSYYYFYLSFLPTSTKPVGVNIEAPLNLRTLWHYMNQFLTFNI